MSRNDIIFLLAEIHVYLSVGLSLLLLIWYIKLSWGYKLKDKLYFFHLSKSPEIENRIERRKFKTLELIAKATMYLVASFPIIGFLLLMLLEPFKRL